MKEEHVLMYKVVFTYLDKLREEGTTNMFGATPYLRERYGFTQSEAHEWLSLWMKTFDQPSMTSRIEKALELNKGENK